MRVPALLALLLLPILLLMLLLKPASGLAWSEEEKPTMGKVSDRERDEAILRGLRYLDKTVFKLPDAQGTPKKQFTVGVTGLVQLLASGKGSRTAGKGESLRKARAFLARYVASVAKRIEDDAQLPDGAGMFSSNRAIQYTWPVALAGLFFGELHARGKHTGEARVVLKQVRSILRKAQHEGGGWGHHQTRANPPAAGSRGAGLLPEGMGKLPKGMGGYPETLLCCSFVVGSTLGLLEGSGAQALPKHLRRAVDYFRTAQLSNGNFPYDPSQRSAQRSLNGVSRSAGSAFAMWTLGVPFKDKSMQLTLGFIDEHFDYLNEGHGSSTLNLMYGALLQKMRGPRAWKRFKARYFRPLVAGQAADGACACICENKAFGATNDSDPFGALKKGPGASVMQRAGDMGAFKALTKDTTGAYITAIHTFILLLDRTELALLGGKRPKVPSGAPGAVTPR
jgi:hypothetical protein